MVDRKALAAAIKEAEKNLNLLDKDTRDSIIEYTRISHENR